MLQVHLIDYDDRLKTPFLGSHHKSVNKMQLEFWLPDATDNNHLIYIGDNDLLRSLGFFTNPRTREFRLARVYNFYTAGAIRNWCKIDQIANRHW